MALPLGAEPTWVNYQAARLVIGQTSFTRQNPASSRTAIGGVGGVAVDGQNLFIADGNRVGSSPVNNRVLIYKNLSSFLPRPDAALSQDSGCPACVGLPDVVLGQTNFETFTAAAGAGMQNASAVACDGFHLVVADTDNNRVLIWRGLPATNGRQADIVVGQPDFATRLPNTSRAGLRGPQGVWLDGGRLFIADTQNSRVLIYNSIPTANGANADVVLGQKDFDTRPSPDLTQSNVMTTSTSMLDPVSVTVKNGRMFVTDLGFNRVLIFLTVPTSNTAPADVVIGQLNMEGNRANNSSELCDPTGEKDEDDNDIYPRRCDATLSFPRFALSDGTRLYVSDGGNDRILIFNQIPMVNGAPADVVLGQPDFESLVESEGPESVRSATSLAHDGENLYVADPFTRRVLVFTPGENMIAQEGLRNAASFRVLAQGYVMLDGDPALTTGEMPTVVAGQDLTITIGNSFTSEDDDVEYKYTIVDGDTRESARDKLMALLNDDPNGLVTGRAIVGAGTFAVGRVTFGGEIRVGDTVTLTIADRVYRVTTTADDTITGFVDNFQFFIENGDDPNVVSEREFDNPNTLLLTSRNAGPAGNSIPYSVTLSPGALVTVEVDGETLEGGSFPYGIRILAREEGDPGNDITLAATASSAGISFRTSGSTLTGGSDARELPAGSLAAIFGENLAPFEMGATLVDGRLPTELAGVQVYTNGVLSPLLAVSPNQINFQVPYEALGRAVSVYVRRTNEGTVMASAPRGTNVTLAAPGLFAFAGPEPRQGVVAHAAGPATGTVAITVTTTSTGTTEPTVAAGVTATVIINGREYSYTTVEGDTATSVRDRLIERVNEGDGDPEVTAFPQTTGFFSARADVTFGGEIQAGDVVTLIINNRAYSYTVRENDTLVAVRNILVERVNSGLGDPDVFARRIEQVGSVVLQLVARTLGTAGNSIPFTVQVSEGARITATSNVEEEGVLQGGQTPPVILLVARESGRQGNFILIGGNTSNGAVLTVTPNAPNLCCGNESFSLVTDENPAVPGETIVVFGSGMGLTAPTPASIGLVSGMPTPADPLLLLPTPGTESEFVSSQVGIGNRTAQVEFSGLMPGFVGVYQINLKLNGDLPDDPRTTLFVAQAAYISNIITFPVKNLRPKRDQADTF